MCGFSIITKLHIKRKQEIIATDDFELMFSMKLEKIYDWCNAIVDTGSTCLLVNSFILYNTVKNTIQFSIDEYVSANTNADFVVRECSAKTSKFFEKSKKFILKFCGIIRNRSRWH